MTAAPRPPQAVPQAAAVDISTVYGRGFLDGAVLVIACMIVFGLLMLALWSIAP